MDNLEKFIRDNRDAFDKVDPPSNLWPGVENGLNAGGQAAGQGALAKLSLAAKAGIGAAVTAVVAGAIWLATTVFGGGGTPGTSDSNGQLAGTPAAEAAWEDPADAPLAGRTSPVQPPLPGVNIPFLTHTVNSRQAEVWTTPSGTRIHIPEGAFVDADGNPVKGKVDLGYREFHDGADVFLSGITMKVKDRDKTEDFQTAGMMEIRATQKGENVFLAPGKSLDVEFASRTDEEGHHVWYLNEETGNWEDLGVSEMKPLDRKAARGQTPAPAGEAPMAESADPAAPVAPRQATDRNSFDFAADYSRYPELSTFAKVRWQFEKPGDLNQHEWIFAEVWSSVELLPGEKPGTYRLELKNKRKNFSGTIVPALEGKELAQARQQFEEKMQEYSSTRTQRLQDESRVAIQARIFRTFQVNRMGIFNCDRYYNMANAIRTRVKFEVPGVTPQTRAMSMFHISGDDRGVVEMNLPLSGEEMALTFPPGTNNILLAVMPDGKLGIVGENGFRAMADARDQHTVAEVKFHPIDREINTADDLREAFALSRKQITQ